MASRFKLRDHPLLPLDERSRVAAGWLDYAALAAVAVAYVYMIWKSLRS